MKDELRIFFARSKLRLEVLRKLNEKPQIASFLSHEIHKHRETVSRIFLDFVKMGFAECSNPESPHFRFYRLTKKGKTVLNEIGL